MEKRDPSFSFNRDDGTVTVDQGDGGPAISLDEFRNVNPEGAAKHDEMVERLNEAFGDFGIPPPAGFPGSDEG